MRGDEVVSVRGDDDDVFSHGFLCPKSQGLKQLHDDPDRLTTPLVRRDGELVEASWEEAFAAVAEGLGAGARRGRARRGRRLPRQPGAHSLGPMLYGAAAAEGARHEEHLLGLDRRPDAEAGLGRAHVRRRAQRPGPRRRPHRPPADPRRQPAGLERLAADRARHARADPGDPRARRQGRGRRPAPQPHRQRGRPSTTSSAPAPTPTCCSRSPTCCSPRSSPTRAGSPSTPTAPSGSRRSPSRSRPRRSRRSAGSTPTRSAGMARELAGAERAAVYARIGTTTQRFGTLASWLVDVAQLPDRQPRPRGRGDVPAGRGRPAQLGRRAARPARASGSGAGRAGSAGGREVFGELPVVGAGRGDHDPGRGPGAGAGHDRRQPAGLDPRLGALAEAVETLDFMVSVDIYVNETTRHADVILPAPEPLAKAHYDFALYQLAVRSVANYSAPVLDAARGPAARVGDRSCGSPRSPPARGPTPTSRPGTTS